MDRRHDRCVRPSPTATTTISRRRFATTASLLGLGVTAGSFAAPEDARAAPTATIHAGRRQHPGFPVTLDDSQSQGRNIKGQDGDIHGIKHVSWDFGDGSPPASGPYLNTVAHVFAQPGTYTVSLTVTDYADATAAASTTIEVRKLPRVRVKGKDDEAIAAAIKSLKGRPGIVSIPPGRYEIRSRINIPGDIVLKGAGRKKTALTVDAGGTVLRVEGNNVRITGIEIAGPKRKGIGMYVYDRRNLVVDACDIHDFEYGIHLSRDASATIEGNSIHDQRNPGSGYGVLVTAGSYAMVRKNRFARNRHHVTGNGDINKLDNTGFDVIENFMHGDNPAEAGTAVDMHASGHGRIRVYGNLFEDLKFAQQYMDGWGEITNNTFRNVSVYVLRLGTPERGGKRIRGAGAHYLDFRDNVYERSTTTVWLQYADNVRINCRRVDDLVPYDAEVDWDDCP